MDKKPRYRSTFYYEGHRYETTGKTQKEADQKAAVRREQLKRGEIGISGNMTVARWAEEWLETYKRPSVGEGQYKNYLLYIDGVIIPAIGSMTLKSVKDVHLQKILNSRARKSKSDLSKLRMTIKAIFQRAYQSKLIVNNPAEFLELPAAKDGTHRSITDAEREAVLKLAETHHAGLWVKMILYCGLRPGETRALDWRHIDFKNKLIHVEQAMKAHSTIIDEPKTKAGIRNIPIPDVYYNDLLAARKGPFDPVFTKPETKGRHDKASMDRLFKSFRRELNIMCGATVKRNKIIIKAVADDLVPYCLRHTYCTDLQDKGVPINIARYLMGHSDISLTAKIYTHTTDKAIQEAANKINANSG
ncbi:MAG: site-specific integrase [Oscillospiraceae bacterium]|jgi:integrase|nr:site-specific integrase [Oscillospiraceae bacterium]